MSSIFCFLPFFVYILMGCGLRYPYEIISGDHCVINRDVLLDGRGALLTIGNKVDIAQEVVIWTLDFITPS